MSWSDVPEFLNVLLNLDHCLGTQASWQKALSVIISIPAEGVVTFSVTPADGDTVTLNGVEFTFRDAPGDAQEVQTDADIATAINNLIAAIGAVAATNTSPGYQLRFANYSQIAPGVLDIVSYYQPTPDASTSFPPPHAEGYDPNAYTLAASVAAVSGATLLGGSIAAQMLTPANFFGSLPTADPHVYGEPWVDPAANYVVKVSQG